MNKPISIKTASLFSSESHFKGKRKVKQCVKIPFDKSHRTEDPKNVINLMKFFITEREREGKDNRKFISTSMIIRMEWTNQQA
jgi:hypothetical protein